MRSLSVVLFTAVTSIDAQMSSKRRFEESKHPGRTRRIVHLLLVFIAAIIIVDGLVGERGLLAMLRARREYDGLAGSIARSRTENARLRDEARRLREDPTTIEEVARRELGLMKPGEKVFIIRDIRPPAEK